MKYLIAILMIFALIQQAQAAGDSVIHVDGDLMIHPNQISDFFNLASTQINSASQWNWATLQFTKPYNVTLTGVLAQGPWTVQFDTSALANQELGFTMSWADPLISIGQFAIHDTVSGTVDGIPYNVFLDGTCSNMQLKIPSGQWQVTGRLRWDVVKSQFVPQWESFALQNNAAAVAQVNLGQCQGPASLFQTLSNVVTAAAGNHDWLQSLLQQGILDWAQTSLGGLGTQLLAPRNFQIKSPVNGSWIPAQMAAIGGGIIRIPGQLVIDIPGATQGADEVTRNYDPSILTAVTDSGFIFPQGTMQRVLAYLYANGALWYRLNSLNISAFQSLMSSRLLQFFLWPDLLSFATGTQFYFDLSARAAPQLSGGQMLGGGGSSYNISLPLLARQWAPTQTQYLQYIDFTSPVSGQLTAKITNGSLNLQLIPSGFNLTYAFDPQYAATRSENMWLASGIIGSHVSSYLSSTPYTFQVPTWQVGTQLGLTIGDVQVWPDSFRLPIQLNSN